MSASAPASPPPRRSLLPAWAAPRAQDPGGDPASFTVRTLETVFAILVAIVLAVAVVHDVKRQVDINLRTAADGRSWLSFALAHDQPYAKPEYKRLGIRLLEHGTTDYACQPTGLTRAVAIGQHRLCLMISGPIVRGRRTVDGGYFLPPTREDRYINRYACFGEPARLHFCAHRYAPKVTRLTHL